MKINQIIDEDCGECEKPFSYTLKDINEHGQIVCPDCGTIQNPCAGCISVNDKLNNGLKCYLDHLERVKYLKLYMSK